MINSTEVLAVLTANGFKSPSESWKEAYDLLVAHATGYSSPEYPDLHAKLTDIIHGGSLLAPKDVSKETIDVFFLAASHVAQYQITAAPARDWSDTEYVYDVADEE